MEEGGGREAHLINTVLLEVIGRGLEADPLELLRRFLSRAVD